MLSEILRAAKPRVLSTMRLFVPMIARLRLTMTEGFLRMTIGVDVQC